MARRLLVSLLAGAALAWATASEGAVEDRPSATLDDVLAMQTFGSASLSPDGRWAVWERRAAYDTAPRFDRGVRSGMATTTLSIAAVNGGAMEALLPDSGQGLLLGPWSPDSRRLVIYRWRQDTLEMGIVDLETRRVRWTGLTPDLGNTGVATAWASDRDLAVTLRSAGDLPWPFRFEGTGEEVASARWRQTAQGQRASRTAFETGNGAARVEDGPSTPRRLVLIDAATGASKALFEGAIRDMAPSPDGRQIAVLEAGERTPLPLEERAVQSAILTRGRLVFIDIGNGWIARSPAEVDAAPHLLRWSPDSRRALVWARSPGAAWSEGGIVAMSLNGRMEAFASKGLAPADENRTIDELRPVRADWLGERPILYARTAAGRFDWWMLGGAEPVGLTARLGVAPNRIAAHLEARGGAALIVADDAVWKMTPMALTRVYAAGGDLLDADPGDARAPLRLRLNAPPVRDWALVSDRAAITAVDQTGGRAWGARLAPCAGAARILAVAPDAVLRLCLEQGLERLDLANGSGSRLMDQLNAGMGALASAQPITHRDRTGRIVQSYLYLPPDSTAAAVKGLVVHLYPGGGDDGRHIDGANLHMGPRPQLLAMGGYAVLSVSIPSERESRRDAMFDDFTQGVELAVDAALAAVPNLPRDRIAIVGHSFGGYAALGVATRSTRFQAYAVWAAPTDMIGKWGEFLPQARTWPEEGLSLNQSMGSVETGQGGLGAPPWDAIDAYVAASPALLADRITAPVLLITADRDYVPMSQSERLFTALHRLGKPARLVVYWGEGHDNASPANIRDVYREIFTWLDRAMGPSPAGGPPRP